MKGGNKNKEKKPDYPLIKKRFGRRYQTGQFQLWFNLHVAGP
jgi:hypothetical protein